MTTGLAQFPVSRQDLAYLIDGVMVLMRQMERAPLNDKSELPELQGLLDRLMTFSWPGQ